MPIPLPNDPRFWSDEGRNLWHAVAELAMRGLGYGMAGGAMLMPENLRDLVSWDVLNQAAVDYLHQYRLATVDGITETTAKQAIAQFDAWMQAGEPLDLLQARVAPIFGPERAGRIATTEVTRLYARGNQLAWNASGVVAGNSWRTARDERVCPVCGALHGLVAPVGGAFEIPPDRMTPEMARLLMTTGQFISAPPAHVNCRCWLQPVVTEASLREQIQRTLA